VREHFTDHAGRRDEKMELPLLNLRAYCAKWLDRFRRGGIKGERDINGVSYYLV